MRYTENLKLKLPEQTDPVDVDVLSENFERLDDFAKEAGGSGDITAIVKNMRVGDITYSTRNLEEESGGEFIACDQRTVFTDAYPELCALNTIKTRVVPAHAGVTISLSFINGEIHDGYVYGVTATSPFKIYRIPLNDDGTPGEQEDLYTITSGPTGAGAILGFYKYPYILIFGVLNSTVNNKSYGVYDLRDSTYLVRDYSGDTTTAAPIDRIYNYRCGYHLSDSSLAIVGFGSTRSDKLVILRFNPDFTLGTRTVLPSPAGSIESTLDYRWSQAYMVSTKTPYDLKLLADSEDNIYVMGVLYTSSYGGSSSTLEDDDYALRNIALFKIPADTNDVEVVKQMPLSDITGPGYAGEACATGVPRFVPFIKDDVLHLLFNVGQNDSGTSAGISLKPQLLHARLSLDGQVLSHRLYPDDPPAAASNAAGGLYLLIDNYVTVTDSSILFYSYGYNANNVKEQGIAKISLDDSTPASLIVPGAVKSVYIPDTKDFDVIPMGPTAQKSLSAYGQYELEKMQLDVVSSASIMVFADPNALDMQCGVLFVNSTASISNINLAIRHAQNYFFGYLSGTSTLSIACVVSPVNQKVMPYIPNAYIKAIDNSKEEV